jgi:hypothetical protein
MENSANGANPLQVNAAQKKLLLEKQMKSGANNFFWIAGLSLINTVIYTMGGSVTFVMGLGITQIIDSLARRLGVDGGSNSMVIRFLGLGIDLAIAGMFMLFGVLSRKRNRKVLVFGAILYIMDALIFLYVQDWYALLFHGLMLFGLWNGYRAMGGLASLEENPATPTPMTVSDYMAGTGGPMPVYLNGKGKKAMMIILLVLSGIMAILTFIAFNK